MLYLLQTTMPDFPTGIFDKYGANGLIVLGFALLLWRGVPAFKSWLDSLLVTFQTEIQREREAGDKRLAELRSEFTATLTQQRVDFREELQRNRHATANMVNPVLIAHGLAKMDPNETNDDRPTFPPRA